MLNTKKLLDENEVNEQAGALAAAAGHPFYNTSKFTLKSLLNTGKRQQLTSNFVALPLNIFYNTGIATYIWVLSNRKPENRQGKVQLIDGTQMFEKLRKNLGSKNCQLSPQHIADITRMFLECEESETSKMFPNEAFGYWKITVERPLKLKTEFADDRLAAFSQACADHKSKKIQALPPLVDALAEKLGAGPHMDFAEVADAIDELSDEMDIKVNKTELKFIREHFCEPDEAAAPIVAKRTKLKKGQTVANVLPEGITPDRAHLYGFHFEPTPHPNASTTSTGFTPVGTRLCTTEERADAEQAGVVQRQEPTGVNPGGGEAQEPTGVNPRGAGAEAEPFDVSSVTHVTQYEESSDLRDTEQIPLQEDGGIEAFFHREVTPHVPDAWIDPESTKVGYEIPFTRHFYKYEPLRSLEEITKDIRELENETEGLLEQITEVVA